MATGTGVDAEPTLRDLLLDLIGDEWAGWGYDEDTDKYRCFYCKATTEKDGYRHRKTCPLYRARRRLEEDR